MLSRFKKRLRQSATDAEQKLWFYIRDRRFNGFKFRRQHVLHGYIVDFVCLEKRFIIEFDGGQHAEPIQMTYDSKRTAILEAKGFQIIRFWNHDVLKDTHTVLAMMDEVLKKPLTRARNARPLPQGER